jgi:acyl-CoA synthetase (NDP forming)
MGFPVVMKIVSPDIIHKTDSGGVRLNIRNTTEAGNSYGEILSTVRKKHPGVRIEGVSVQKMVSRGVELIIGVTKDAQFGPVLMFGLGGIFVEVLKDVSFKIIPLTRKDAQDMIKEIKGYPVLGGFRGQEAVSIPILEDVILKVSEFVDTNPEIKELDINPIFAYKEGATAVDARIILEPMARDSL